MTRLSRTCYSYRGVSSLAVSQANRVRRCAIRCFCTHCSGLVVQDSNENGINFCPHCQELFEGVAEKMPPWILGVLVVLMAVCLIICHH